MCSEPSDRTSQPEVPPLEPTVPCLRLPILLLMPTYPLICQSIHLFISPPQLIGKSNFITRPKLLDYTATREELLWRSGEVFDWVAQGKMNVSVDKVFPLAECGDGHIYLEAGKSTGKVLYDCALSK